MHPNEVISNLEVPLLKSQSSSMCYGMAAKLEKSFFLVISLSFLEACLLCISTHYFSPRADRRKLFLLWLHLPQLCRLAMFWETSAALRKTDILLK